MRTLNLTWKYVLILALLHPCSCGLDGPVFAIAVSGYHDTTVYAAGDFFQAGGRPAMSVARYSFGSWTALAETGATLGGSPAVISSISFVVAPPVGAMAGDPAPLRPHRPCLLAVGRFDSMGGLPIRNAAILCLSLETGITSNISASVWVPAIMDTDTLAVSAAYTYVPD